MYPASLLRMGRVGAQWIRTAHLPSRSPKLQRTRRKSASKSSNTRSDSRRGCRHPSNRTRCSRTRFTRVPRKRPGIRLSEHRGQQAAVPRTFTGFGWETPAVLRGLSTTDEPYVVGAYVLVHELRSAQGDFEVAFTRFHALMAPYVARCQQLALNTLEVDGAKSPWATWLRMLGLWSLRLPGVRQLVARQALKVGRSFALPTTERTSCRPPRPRP